VNGTALPGIRASAGMGAALANPLAPTIDVRIIAAAAPVAAMNVLVLDIAPLSVLSLSPVGRPGPAIPRACLYPQETFRKGAHTKL
jgi:hypothetical protein